MKTRNKNIITIIALTLAMTLASTSCTKEIEEINTATLVAENNIEGTYHAVITPKMAGIVPMAQGPHIIHLDMQPQTGLLRLHYTGFNAPFIDEKTGKPYVDADGKPTQDIMKRMPFDMTIDFHMKVRRTGGGALELYAEKGRFKASPHADKPISEDDLPPGIALPPGGLGGFDVNYASITGTWRDGILHFIVQPKILPVAIDIITTAKQ